MFLKATLRSATVVLVLAGGTACSYKHRKYENPITQATDQPDKILFDKAVKDLEKGHYEVARIQLQTLLNTYESSEFAAKAKLAVADSWFREGGIRGMTQAEAEYKDFILFYPAMEEAAEAQNRICDLHMNMMEKPDRDRAQAQRAEYECRQLLLQFPNSKFVPDATQRLREVQEVLADGEFRTGDFYHNRGSFNAAANRLGGVVDQYPLYSKADESLWETADSFRHLGASFRGRESDALVRIVRDYPLSARVDDAKKRLAELEVPIPEADPMALSLMQANVDSRVKPGMFSRAFGFMRHGPDTWTAAKNGVPQMNPPKANIPPLVPAPGQNAGFRGDVTVAPVTNPSALEQNPDARPANQQPPATGSAPAQAPADTKQ